MLVGFDIGGSLKEHMLEQVSEAGSSGALVGGADVVPEVHRNNWGGWSSESVTNSPFGNRKVSIGIRMRSKLHWSDGRRNQAFV
jgi:hypothetical protein